MKRHKRHCILIVDDDRAVTEFVAQVLREAAFEVLEAKNGKDAVSIVNHRMVDLVVTDLFMPEQEGLETVLALRRSHPSLPIIAVSGVFGGQFLKVAMAFGAKAAIAKPFTKAKLLGAVQEALGIGPSSDVPESAEPR